MARDWVVVPGLLVLRQEFDLVSPHRDRGSDGTKGDSNHNVSSDHTPDEESPILRDHDPDDKNEVHALDIDSTGPWPGGAAWFDAAIKKIVARERKRWLDPHDMCRLNYTIWNRQIADKDVDDFAWRPYHGTADDHTGHAHFSLRYETQAENDVSPWGLLEEDDMDLDTMMTLSKETQAALGIQPKNGQLEFDSYLGTLGIRIGQINARTMATAAQVEDLLKKFGPVVEPDATPEQKATALKVLLGPDAGTVGALLAGQK